MLGLILEALFAGRKLALIQGIAQTVKTVHMVRRVMNPHYGIRLYTSRLFAGLSRSEALHGIFLSKYKRDKLLIFRISKQIKKMQNENGVNTEIKSQIRKYLRRSIEMQKRATKERLKQELRDKRAAEKEYAKGQRKLARLQKRLGTQNRNEVGKIFRKKQSEEKREQFARGRQHAEDRGYLMGYRHLSNFRNWATPDEAARTAQMKGDTRFKQRPVIALPFFSTGLHEGIYYRDTHSARLFMKRYWYSFKNFRWWIFKKMADAGSIYQPSYLNGWRGAGTVYGREYKGVFNYKNPLSEDDKLKRLNFLGRGGTVKNTGETRFVKNFNKGLIHTKKEHRGVKTKGVDEFAYLPGRKYKYKFTNKRELAKQQKAFRKQTRRAAKQYQKQAQKRYNVHGGDYGYNRLGLLF